MLKDANHQLIVGISGSEDPSVKLVELIRDLLPPPDDGGAARPAPGGEDEKQRLAPRRGDRAISMPRL
jgi:hypothetical protein